MINNTSGRSVQVTLPESLIQVLIDLHGSLDSGVKDALQDHIAGFGGEFPEQLSKPNAVPDQAPPTRRYAGEFLDTRITAWSLPGMFAQFVDLTAEVAPEVLERLSEMGGHRRRYIARDWADIHPGRPDLDVMRTGSGWWISKNISRKDLVRGLRALACAADLECGTDLKFPAPNG